MEHRDRIKLAAMVAVEPPVWNTSETQILTVVPRDNTILIWDAETGAELDRLQGASDKALWNADESLILSGTARFYTRVEDLQQAACARTPRNLTQEEWQRFMGERPYRRTRPDLPPDPKFVLNLANTYEVDEAVSQLQQVLERNPNPNLDPTEEARQLIAQALLEQGRALAKESKVKEAIAKFQQAKGLDPTLNLEPEAKAEQLAASQGISKD